MIKKKGQQKCWPLYLAPAIFYSGEIASVGQTSAQAPQSVQSSGSIL